VRQRTDAHHARYRSRLLLRPAQATADAVTDETTALDETRNCGELLLRPGAELVLGRAVQRCGPTARFVRSYNRRRLTRTGGHTAELPPRETKSGAPIVVANLVPTHDRGPGPPGGRSTWLLLSPRTSSGFDARGTAAPWAKQPSRRLPQHRGPRLLPDRTGHAGAAMPEASSCGRNHLPIADSGARETTCRTCLYLCSAP
jgi:hypothetical protein